MMMMIIITILKIMIKITITIETKIMIIVITIINIAKRQLEKTKRTQLNTKKTNDFFFEFKKMDAPKALLISRTIPD